MICSFQLGISKVAEFRKALPEFRKVSNLRCVLAPFWAVFYIFEEKSKNIYFDFQSIGLLESSISLFESSISLL